MKKDILRKYYRYFFQWELYFLVRLVVLDGWKNIKYLLKRKQNMTRTDFYIDDGILLDYNGTKSSVTIPNGVVAIGREAFYKNEDIKSVKIPSSVTSIGDAAYLVNVIS